MSTVDGHPLRGSFTFAVGEASAPGQSAPARPPLLQSPLEPFLRWLGLLAALALVGGFGFNLLVAAPVWRSYEKVAASLATGHRLLDSCRSADGRRDWKAAGTSLGG